MPIDEEKKEKTRYVVDQDGKFDCGFTLFPPAKDKQQIQSAEAFKELNIGAKVFR